MSRACALKMENSAISDVHMCPSGCMISFKYFLGKKIPSALQVPFKKVPKNVDELR